MSTSKNSIILVSLFLVKAISPGAWAAEQDSESGKPVPCAVLEKFDGELELLDPDRTHFIDTKADAPLPCAGWVSVQNGWAIFKHYQGYRIRVGSESFVQFFDRAEDGSGTGSDHLVVFKGKVYVEVQSGALPIQIRTANARVSGENMIAIVSFNPVEQKTQLVSLANSSKIENQFEPGSTVTVKAGEASDLNFKLMRVVPSTPRAVAVASLKEKLSEFPLESTEVKTALAAAALRGDRTFPVKFEDRKIASVAPEFTYERNRASPTDGEANEQWVKRLVGGSEKGAKALFPERNTANAHVLPRKKAALEIENIKSKKAQDEMEGERKRLEKELSEITLTE